MRDERSGVLRAGSPTRRSSVVVALVVRLVYALHASDAGSSSYRVHGVDFDY
jgi:hypothetical protein